MRRKLTISLSLLLILSLAACSGNSSVNNTENPTVIADPNVTIEEQSKPVVEPTTGEELASVHVEVHGDPDDYIWDSADISAITLEGDRVSTSGVGIDVQGSVVTITSAGTYQLSGELQDGQIVVNTDDEDLVCLILDGVTIHNASGPAIYIQDADRAMIVLADGSENKISDSSNYVLEEETDEPNATLFSTADLTIFGNGSLEIMAAFNDGIASKDGLLISSGKIKITSVDDGMRGKDYVVIENGEILIESGGDGIKSDEEIEDLSKGFITIQTGSISIKSQGDAIEAASDVNIFDGTFSLITEEGNDAQDNQSTSRKAIKGVYSVNISGGDFTIDSIDDGLHSNNILTINAGKFEITTGDDGMHADTTLTIHDGEIMIDESYEGLESATITINGGYIQLLARDDGINLAGGVDGSGMNPGFPLEGRPPRGGGPGQDAFAGGGNYHLHINGGTILVESGGDGIDSNGSITMTGGVLLVNGPTEDRNGAIDYIGTFTLSGGILIAAGSSGMSQGPDNTSTQNSVLVNFNSMIDRSTLIHVQTSTGDSIFSFAPTKRFQSIVFSMPQLQTGASYSVYLGGNTSGDSIFGWYQTGAYSGGTEAMTFTISDVVTQLGPRGGFRR